MSPLPSALPPAVARGVVAGAIAAMGVLVFESLEGPMLLRQPSDVPGGAVKAPFALHLCHGAAWGGLHAIGRSTGAPTTAVLALHTTAPRLAATEAFDAAAKTRDRKPAAGGEGLPRRTPEGVTTPASYRDGPVTVDVTSRQGGAHAPVHAGRRFDA